MRPLIAAAVVASVAGYFVFGRTAAPAEDLKPAAKLKAVQKRFNDEVEELNERLQAAKSAAEEKGIHAEAREQAAITLGKVLKVAEEHPKDEVVADAAQYALVVLTRLGVDGPDLDKLVGLVVEHHLASPRMKDLVRVAAGAGAAGEKLLLAAADKAADKTVQAVGLFALGQLAGERADAAPDEKAAAELTAQALAYYERARKAAPDLPVGDAGTLADVIDDEVKTLQKLSVGKPAPDVTSVDLDGKPVKLSDYRGKVVLVDIWATWCGPCRAMIPHSRELVEKFKGRPFALVGVSVDEDKDDVVRFKKQVPMPWAQWFDGAKGPVAKAFRVKANPTLYLIDAKGVIRKRWIGIPDGDPKSPAIDQAVEKLLKEVG